MSLLFRIGKDVKIWNLHICADMRVPAASTSTKKALVLVRVFLSCYPIYSGRQPTHTFRYEWAHQLGPHRKGNRGCFTWLIYFTSGICLRYSTCETGHTSRQPHRQHEAVLSSSTALDSYNSLYKATPKTHRISHQLLLNFQKISLYE